MLGKRLKEERKRQKLTQVDFAKTMNVTKGTISTWETGTRLPTLETLCNLADLFGESLDYLVGRDDERHAYTTFKKCVDTLVEIAHKEHKTKEERLSALRNYAKYMESRSIQKQADESKTMLLIPCSSCGSDILVDLAELKRNGISRISSAEIRCIDCSKGTIGENHE